MKSNLKKIMENKGVTIRELREKTAQKDSLENPMALSTATILNARDDQKIRTCRLGKLEAIARALDVSVKDLFDDDITDDPHGDDPATTG